jgi:LysM domain
MPIPIPMNIKLNCPVCGYKEIVGDICPNCDTDVSLMRILEELPPTVTPRPKKVTRWQLLIAAMILLIGMGLGTGGCWFWLQPHFIVAVNSPNPVVVVQGRWEDPNISSKQTLVAPQLGTYQVQSGEYLSVLAEKFCGKGTSWKVIVGANPQLEGRENHLEVGEKLYIPDCKEKV